MLRPILIMLPIVFTFAGIEGYPAGTKGYPIKSPSSLIKNVKISKANASEISKYFSENNKRVSGCLNKKAKITKKVITKEKMPNDFSINLIAVSFWPWENNFARFGKYTIIKDLKFFLMHPVPLKPHHNLLCLQGLKKLQ